LREIEGRGLGEGQGLRTLTKVQEVPIGDGWLGREVMHVHVVPERNVELVPVQLIELHSLLTQLLGIVLYVLYPWIVQLRLIVGGLLV
jgi:hypothetical protein